MKTPKSYVCIFQSGSTQGTEKITLGIATNPRKRLQELQAGSPEPLVLLAAKPFPSSKESATEVLLLHKLFSQFRSSGEWFNTSEVILNIINEPGWIPESAIAESSGLRVPVLVDESIYKHYKNVARRRNQPVSTLIREALSDWAETVLDARENTIETLRKDNAPAPESNLVPFPDTYARAASLNA